MITTTDLAKSTGADTGTSEDELQRALDAATADLDRVLANAWREVPDIIRDIWTLDTAINYFKRSASSDGGLLTGADGTGVPGVANDPLQKSWPAIKAYINRL